MAESIFARVRRVVSGKMEDGVDEVERAHSDTVMREAIREVDRAIDEVRREQDAAVMRRLQATRQQDLCAKRAGELTGKAQFALAEGREDLAQGALSRQVDLEAEAEKLDAVQELARNQEAKLEESLSALRARKKQMEDSLNAFLLARSEVAAGGEPGEDAARGKRMDNAEAAFDRAMTGGGGIGFSRGDAEAINQVAEIDTLSRRASVAERLAMLKAATPPTSGQTA